MLFVRLRLASVCPVTGWGIVDHSPWVRLDQMVTELGSVQALDSARLAGSVEVTEVTGAGGATILARHVTRRHHKKGLVDVGWLDIHEMAYKMGCSTRTINNRVQAGVMEQRLIRGATGGGMRSQVRVKR